MIWKGEKVMGRGVPDYDVMDHVHEGYNYSDDDMLFLFVDILKTNDNRTCLNATTQFSLNMNMITGCVVVTIRLMFVATPMVD